jgi:hypothetical protein
MNKHSSVFDGGFVPVSARTAIAFHFRAGFDGTEVHYGC